MSLYSPGSVERVAENFGGNAPVTMKKALTELQGFKVSVVTGFAAGVSAAITGLSAAGGDTLLSAVTFGTGAAEIADLTGSSSFSNDRIVIADTGTTGQKILVHWWNKDNA